MELICEISNGDVRPWERIPENSKRSLLSFKTKTEKSKKYLFQQGEGSIVWGKVKTNTQKVDRFMPWSVNMLTSSSQSKALCGVIFEDI